MGSVARFHAEVVQAAGYTVSVGCGTSEDSPRWQAFKSVAPQARFEPDGRAVLCDPDVDAVVACLPWDMNESWLPDLLSTTKPVLLEKPVALSSSVLSEAIDQNQETISNKMVGLNRRFYRTVQELKRRIEGGGVKSVELTISETVQGLANTYGDEIISHVLVYSSCHILDTACRVLGPLKPIKIYEFAESQYARPFSSISGVLETSEGAPVYLNVLADNPSPVGLRVFFDDQTTWHLSPIERLVAYQGYEVIEPNGEVKIRRYVPKAFLEINEDTTFKPGFLAQMEAFISGQDRSISATIKEGLELLMFTEEIQRMAKANILTMKQSKSAILRSF